MTGCPRPLLSHPPLSHPLLLALALASLVACQPQPPAEADTAPASVGNGETPPGGMSADDIAPAEGMTAEELGPAEGMSPGDMEPASTMPSSDAAASGPSFDCGKAGSEAEKLVCADPGLAALDRRMADEYGKSLEADGADAATLKATQRGWVKGRDDCWKADDAPACVREAYLTRLVQLQLDRGAVMVPTPVEYTCDDNSKPFTAVFYNDLDPRAAVLTWGDDQAIVFPSASGSGAKYGRQGVEFWEHQGEATVDFFGNKLVCKAPG